MFEACLEHLEAATVSGASEAWITVFQPTNPLTEQGGSRVWNSQLLRYGGYRWAADMHGAAQPGQSLTGASAQSRQRASATLLHVARVRVGCRVAQLSQAVLQTCCRQEDMSILGDPVELAFTQMIQQEFGWRPRSELPTCTGCLTGSPRYPEGWTVTQSG